MNYEIDMENLDTYAYFYPDDLDTIYLTIPNIYRRGYLKTAKRLNVKVLQEIICIESKCFKMGKCRECPVEKIINRMVM